MTVSTHPDLCPDFQSDLFIECYSEHEGGLQSLKKPKLILWVLILPYPGHHWTKTLLHKIPQPGEGAIYRAGQLMNLRPVPRSLSAGLDNSFDGRGL